jgi:hypothetical protein
LDDANSKELDPTIKVWYEALCFYDIPPSAYPELYKRALDVRQAKLQAGDPNKTPSLDAALLLSQWTGPYGLKAELKQRQIDAGAH